ncbi:MAG: methyltransferase domain-containing protein, partial [Pseudomonadota bacterium]
LAGMVLADEAETIVGVDLAEDILAEADDREVYDALFVGDAVQFLAEEDAPADLIVATDVLPYLGDLTGFFDGVGGCLGPGGVVAFSSEAGSNDWAVGPSHRFLHSEAYLRRMLSAQGLEPLSVEEIVVSLEEGHPAPGHLIIAQKPTGP